MTATVAAERQGSYGALAKAFHWITVLLIAGQYWVMTSIPAGAAGGAPEHEWRWSLHASFGITILLVTLLRLANRLASPPPPHPSYMPGIQVFAANAVHWALYAALIAQPILGWLTLNAYSGPFTFYGLFTVPVLTEIDPGLKQTFGGLHQLLWSAIVVLLAMHIGAALFHGIVKRDGVLSSMARPSAST